MQASNWHRYLIKFGTDGHSYAANGNVPCEVFQVQHAANIHLARTEVNTRGGDWEENVIVSSWCPSYLNPSGKIQWWISLNWVWGQDRIQNTVKARLCRQGFEPGLQPLAAPPGVCFKKSITPWLTLCSVCTQRRQEESCQCCHSDSFPIHSSSQKYSIYYIRQVKGEPRKQHKNWWRDFCFPDLSNYFATNNVTITNRTTLTLTEIWLMLRKHFLNYLCRLLSQNSFCEMTPPNYL